MRKPMSKLQAIILSLGLILGVCWIASRAPAHLNAPDFLQPVTSWWRKVPTFFGQGQAGVVGVPRVQGVTNGDPVIVSDTVANSTSTGTITAACADPGTGCAAGTFVSIATAGQFGAFVHIPNTTNIVGVLKSECSGDGTVWIPTSFNDGVNGKSNVKVLASGVGLDSSITPCRGQQFTRIRLSVLTSGTSTGTVNMYASMAQDDAVRAQMVSPANPGLLNSSNQPAGYSSALIDPLGWLRVSSPSGLFIDPFDGAVIDTTIRWTTAVAGTGGAISQTGGELTLATTTTASAKSNAVTKPTFINSGGSAIYFLANVKLDTTTLPTNVDRFWGFATVPGSPTYAAPITDGMGFELKDTTLTAAVYAAGVKTTVATLTAKTDGAYHRYMLGRRSDIYVWYIDDLDTPVAWTQFVTPAVQTLPAAFAMINNTSAASGSAVFKVSAASVFENVSINNSLSDPNFPFQQAAILAKGSQGAYGLTTQDFKDSGRVSKMYTLTLAATATAETLATLTFSSGLAATTTGSTITVTTGKTMRIQNIFVEARNTTGTTASPCTVRLRSAVSGSITTASPLQAIVVAGTPASAQSTYAVMPITDGFEQPSASTWGITIQQSNWVTASVVATFDVTIVAYEY